MSLRQKFNFTKQIIRGLMPLQDIPHHVFIVGAQKAGTSSLYSYLVQHPKIISGDDKEIGFFNRDKLFNKGSKFYRSWFPLWTAGAYAIDATPEYLYYDSSAQRIHAFKSDAKIVAILREPVSRAFSAFNMYQQICRQKWFKDRLRYANEESRQFFQPLVIGKIKPEVEYFIDTELAIIHGEKTGVEPALLRRGIYSPQLARYFNLFGRENVLVLFSNDLSRNPEWATNQVLEFVDLPPLVGQTYPKKHVREYSADSTAKEVIRQRAGALFAQDKIDLKKHFDIDVPW